MYTLVVVLCLSATGNSKAIADGQQCREVPVIGGLASADACDPYVDEIFSNYNSEPNAKGETISAAICRLQDEAY